VKEAETDPSEVPGKDEELTAQEQELFRVEPKTES